MNIEVFARCRYVDPETSHNLLEVVKESRLDTLNNQVDGLNISFAIFDPSLGTEILNFNTFLAFSAIQETSFAYITRFWESYILVESKPMEDYFGIYGSDNPDILAYFFRIDDIVFIITNRPVKQADNVSFGEGHESFFKRIVKKHPEYYRFFIDKRHKAEVSIKLDSNTSIAALEAQIDLLTEIVLSSIPIEPEYLSKLKESLLNTSVLNLKDKDDLLKSIKNRKSKVRILQANREENTYRTVISNLRKEIESIEDKDSLKFKQIEDEIAVLEDKAHKAADMKNSYREQLK